jgi:hypothetical protein
VLYFEVNQILWALLLISVLLSALGLAVSNRSHA